MDPLTRRETYYAAMAGESSDIPEPVTREEQYLKKIAESGGGGGGSLPSGGTTGQVLTKTDEGTGWGDIPTELPEGGSEGDILTKTSEGVEWQTPPSAGSVKYYNAGAYSANGSVTASTWGYFTSPSIAVVDPAKNETKHMRISALLVNSATSGGSQPDGTYSRVTIDGVARSYQGSTPTFIGVCVWEKSGEAPRVYENSILADIIDANGYLSRIPVYGDLYYTTNRGRTFHYADIDITMDDYNTI